MQNRQNGSTSRSASCVSQAFALHDRAIGGDFSFVVLCLLDDEDECFRCDLCRFSSVFELECPAGSSAKGSHVSMICPALSLLRSSCTIDDDTFVVGVFILLWSRVEDFRECKELEVLECEEPDILECDELLD